MKTRVYVETSVLSYLASRPSRDLLTAAHQEVTHEWWALAQEECGLFISQAVLDESRKGDTEAAQRREERARGLTILPLSREVADLAEMYRLELRMPIERLPDLTHVAFAVVHQLNYLVTWNCAHIANDQVIRKLVEINGRLERFTPLIVTPEVFLELWKEDNP
ncbi:MAG: type II toxin-antitoxin system VapC family toxin [Planctomycetes bacterium]|nr:type II toxin-antitoxin system VapC family toxin [Planctomycetota bacterium]